MFPEASSGGDDARSGRVPVGFIVGITLRGELCKSRGERRGKVERGNKPEG